jgi:predicted regulator of Ras-like GTPase activity (Roadblock/LC7/MglB family)
MLEMQDIQKNLERLKKSQDVLNVIVEETSAFGAFVIEISGEPVFESGQLEGDISVLAIKIAKLWNDSNEVAEILGEVAFDENIFLSGSRHLYVTRCGLNQLLAFIYGTETNLGLIKLYAGFAADHIASLIINEVTPVEGTDNSAEAIE